MNEALEQLDRTSDLAAPLPLRRERLWVRPSLLFITLALLLNAILGEQGLLDGIRARRQMAAARAEYEALRRENVRLSLAAWRLKNDPAAIEMIARQELGLAHPGEILVVVSSVKDGGPPAPPPPPTRPGRRR